MPDLALHGSWQAGKPLRCLGCSAGRLVERKGKFGGFLGAAFIAHGRLGAGPARAAATALQAVLTHVHVFSRWPAIIIDIDRHICPSLAHIRMSRV